MPAEIKMANKMNVSINLLKKKPSVKMGWKFAEFILLILLPIDLISGAAIGNQLFNGIDSTTRYYNSDLRKIYQNYYSDELRNYPMADIESFLSDFTSVRKKIPTLKSEITRVDNTPGIKKNQEWDEFQANHISYKPPSDNPDPFVGIKKNKPKKSRPLPKDEGLYVHNYSSHYYNYRNVTEEIAKNKSPKFEQIDNLLSDQLDMKNLINHDVKTMVYNQLPSHKGIPGNSNVVQKNEENKDHKVQKNEENKDHKVQKNEENKDHKVQKNEENKDHKVQKNEENKDHKVQKNEENKDHKVQKNEENKDHKVQKNEENKDHKVQKNEENKDHKVQKNEENKDHKVQKNEENKDHKVQKNEENKDHKTRKGRRTSKIKTRKGRRTSKIKTRKGRRTSKNKDQKGQKDEQNKDQKGQKDEQNKDQKGQKDEQNKDHKGQKDEQNKDHKGQKDEQNKDQKGQKDEQNKDQKGQKDEQNKDQKGQKDEQNKDQGKGQKDEQNKDQKGQKDEQNKDQKGQKDEQNKDQKGQKDEQNKDHKGQKDEQNKDHKGQKDEQNKDHKGQKDEQNKEVSSYSETTKHSKNEELEDFLHQLPNSETPIPKELNKLSHLETSDVLDEFLDLNTKKRSDVDNPEVVLQDISQSNAAFLQTDKMDIEGRANEVSLSEKDSSNIMDEQLPLDEASQENLTTNKIIESIPILDRESFHDRQMEDFVEFEGSGDLDDSSEVLANSGLESDKSARIFDIFPRFNSTSECTTPKGESGRCLSLIQCPLSEPLNNYNLFLQYLCLSSGILVGICCPDNPVVEIVDPVENSTDNIVTELKQPEDGCGLRTSTRIVGGFMSVPHEWTWMVALLRRNRFFCGGVIINDWYILTAAHCVIGVKVKDLKVRLGEYNFHEKNEHQEDIPVAEIKHHAMFVSMTFQHDIALLKLKRKIEYTNFISSICLPNQSSGNFSGVNATVVGWGTVDFGGKVSPVLRQVTIPVWDNNECARTYRFERINEAFMCAGSPENGEDACQGDSGGPLMAVNDDNRWEVIGIVSWGRRCGDPTYPGVYTRITSYLDWITENTK
ncbi:proclotting enzyme [Caerostris extrusa]|uniref:Proclotting enzyme n=1 Tax=Caerostris extrusa TaxID=172846 RepID=A0AAV4N7Z9_CAEEX|nr:proclotting enzyme [Caerostris extrusa]